jgi:acyl-CoA synthetase (AMP-forming)/AMP-acid ligase II
VTATTWLEMLEVWRDNPAPAVITAEETWSGDELLRRAAGAALRLRALTAPRPVPALLTSSAPAVAYLVGGAASGRPLAPLGPRLTASELVPCVERIDCQVILAERPFAGVASEVAKRTGRRLEWLDIPDPSPDRLALSAHPAAPAFLLHTSGTTGLPKAVPYVEDRLARRARVNAGLCDLGPGSVYASASGFHHIAGLGNYVVALAVGAALAPMPRFTVEAWHDLGKLGVTHALTVPTMLEMLLDADALPLPALRILQYGAAPIHPDTLRRTLDAIPAVGLVNLYGQTEGSPITCLGPEDHLRIRDEGREDLLLSVGRAAPGVDIRIERPDESGVGEVVARGAHLFLVDEDGWMRTGDLGRLDADGYLFLKGRRAEKIIRGGENVYPLEVERVLESHPGVREAAVVGVPDRRWGETVKAVIVAANQDRPPAPDELRAYVRAFLAGFKVPTDWSFLEELPRNANGKLLRRQLRP